MLHFGVRATFPNVCARERVRVRACFVCSLCARERCGPLDSPNDLGLARIVLHLRCLCVYGNRESGCGRRWRGEGEKGGREEASTRTRGGVWGKWPAMQGQREAHTFSPSHLAVARALALSASLSDTMTRIDFSQLLLAYIGYHDTCSNDVGHCLLL